MKEEFMQKFKEIFFSLDLKEETNDLQNKEEQYKNLLYQFSQFCDKNSLYFDFYEKKRKEYEGFFFLHQSKKLN